MYTITDGTPGPLSASPALRAAASRPTSMNPAWLIDE